MYFILLFALACLSTGHCLIEKGSVLWFIIMQKYFSRLPRPTDWDTTARRISGLWLVLYFMIAPVTVSQLIFEENQDHCDVLKQLLESSSVSVELSKKGFHREVVTTVKFKPDLLSDVRVLLLHRWPRGLYVDPYQLASLSEQLDWKILLDSAIDLELPAHKTSGFYTYVYPSHVEPTPRLLKVTIPVHGRYHEPSFVGETFASVDIEAPELLLRTEKCTQLSSVQPHTVVDAPCTVSNSSTCQWVKIQHQQEFSPLRFQFPVGDASLVAPVCGGTLLVTMMCCAALSRHMWKHRII